MSTVEAPPQEEQESRTEPATGEPQLLPPHAVVVFNDDLHTFPYVIETFMKVFGYSKEKSYMLALQIHTNGRGIVWSGTKELAELKVEQIRSAGPDFYAARKVDFPLRAIVEPLPG
jgi:ATP-dependent Clp protease adaptor protein ClpS